MENGWRRRLWLWGPVIAYMALIFVGSSLPSTELPDDMPDKTVHGLVYAGLGALAVRALSGGRWSAIRVATIVGAIAIAVVYGFIDELHQVIVPGRSPDLADVAADLVGAAIGAVTIGVWGIIRSRRRPDRRPR